MTRSPWRNPARRGRRAAQARLRPVGVEALESRALLSGVPSYIQPLSIPLPITSNGGVIGLAKGDFNADGKLDLAVTYITNPNGNPPVQGSVGLLVGDGDGTFKPVVDLALPAPAPAYQHLYGLLARDFNNDGKLDLMVAAYDEKALLYYQGKGDGTFADPVVIPTGISADQVQAADLNHDGKLDVVAEKGDGSVSILLNQGGGSFSAPQTIATHAYGNTGGFALANVDGKDGPDIILGTLDAYLIEVLPNDGTGHFGPIITTATQGFRVRTLIAADFLGDGTTQLVVAGENPPSGAKLRRPDRRVPEGQRRRHLPGSTPPRSSPTTSARSWPIPTSPPPTSTATASPTSS